MEPSIEEAYVAPAGLAVGTTFLRNISVPTLSVFTPRIGSANGVGVVVAPGRRLDDQRVGP